MDTYHRDTWDTYHRDARVAAYGETRADVQKDWAALFGRVLLGAIFVISGFGKLTGFEGTVDHIAEKGLPIPQVLALISILIELGGGAIQLGRSVAVAHAVGRIGPSDERTRVGRDLDLGRHDAGSEQRGKGYKQSSRESGGGGPRDRFSGRQR